MWRKSITAIALFLCVGSKTAYASTEDYAKEVEKATEFCSGTDILDNGFERTRRHCEHFERYSPVLMKKVRDKSEIAQAIEASKKLQKLYVELIVVKADDSSSRLSF